MTELAKMVGVPGAALLIISLGIAIKSDKIAETCRGIIRDWQDHSRKCRELDHRIARDSETIGLEIARKSEQVVKRIGRGAGK
ncbi:MULTISPECIES: hypothetical protein [Methylosinus]|uniref:hypothetical protein n=1 Tax=Methylosinus TaxID=425 RepID=UPI0012DFE234|nr:MULTISPECIES: hypothetical protein [Methylosinus]